MNDTRDKLLKYALIGSDIQVPSAFKIYEVDFIFLIAVSRPIDTTRLLIHICVQKETLERILCRLTVYFDWMLEIEFQHHPIIHVELIHDCCHGPILSICMGGNAFVIRSSLRS